MSISFTITSFADILNQQFVESKKISQIDFRRTFRIGGSCCVISAYLVFGWMQLVIPRIHNSQFFLKMNPVDVA